MYKYLKKLMKKSDRIESQAEEAKGEDGDDLQIMHSQLKFIHQKLQHFINKVHKVFKKPNINIKNEIENYKEASKEIQQKIEDNQDWNEIEENISSLISEIWKSEITGIFVICNTSLLMDIYYTVLDAKEPPLIFEDVN